MYGFKEMSDLAKLSSSHLKEKFGESKLMKCFLKQLKEVVNLYI
jgi:hypothetical protein